MLRGLRSPVRGHTLDFMRAHDHSTHSHASARPNAAALPAALALTAGFAVFEMLAGLWAGSLALLGDAGHMVTDALALGLASAAALISRRPPTERHSFGLARIEVLAAFINAGLMAALIVGIAWHALGRLFAPQPVHGEAVTAVAAAGLAINVLVAWILSRGGHDMNTRAALLHVLGDALGSIAALAAGLTIQLTGWLPIDPLLALLICALIGTSTVRLLRAATHALLEGVPREISLPDVGERMARVEGVVSVHDLHIWSLSSNRIALSAHVVVTDLTNWPRMLGELQALLHDEFEIGHPTLQPELPLPPESAVVDVSRLRRSA